MANSIFFSFISLIFQTTSVTNLGSSQKSFSHFNASPDIFNSTLIIYFNISLNNSSVIFSIQKSEFFAFNSEFFSHILILVTHVPVSSS